MSMQVFKFQRSIASNHGPQWLIYNEAQTQLYEVPDEMIPPLLRANEERLKWYAKADIVDQPDPETPGGRMLVWGAYQELTEDDWPKW